MLEGRMGEQEQGTWTTYTTHPAPHPVCKHTCIHEVLGSAFEYGLLMAAVRGPNAANQAWSRADGGHPGRGEDWAGVNSVLSQTGEGVGGRKERGKRKGKGRKEKFIHLIRTDSFYSF